MTFKIDPKFRDLIPALSEDEYAQLEKNIIAEGCRDPLIVWGGILIDGHNRHDICQKNKIAFKTTERKFADRDEAIQWIINNQFGRRNLSLYDRAALALKYEEIEKKKGKRNMASGGKEKGLTKMINHNTQRILSKRANVSQGTMHKVKFIEEKASAEIKQKIRSGAITVGRAFEDLHKDEKKKRITNIKEHYANNPLDRRIVAYPNLQVFQMHIANSHERLTGKGKVANEIISDYYKALPGDKQRKLIEIFGKMSHSEIERTGRV
jgi:hypothetical protein